MWAGCDCRHSASLAALDFPVLLAAQALRPGGQLFMVANRHLPYEQILNDSFGQVRVAAERDGFKVIVGTRGGRA